jgi:hypothetical protein
VQIPPECLIVCCHPCRKVARILSLVWRPKCFAATLLRNILFFADDPELVELVFQAACEFASLVPVRRLVFVPDQRVWDIIG